MKPLLPIALLSTLILTACVTQVVAPSEAPIVGNDRDAHGCIGSAGYQWSLLKNNCIRIFEDGLRMDPLDASLDQTQSAFLVFVSPQEVARAEVYLPGAPESIILTKNPNNNGQWSDTKYTLTEDMGAYTLSDAQKKPLYQGVSVPHQSSNYSVETLSVDDGNGQELHVRDMDGKEVFSLKPIEGLGSLYAMQDTYLFVDYGTSAGLRKMRIYDVLKKNEVFATDYIGETKLDKLAFVFDIPMDTPADATKCSNYAEIKKMGGSVNYLQKKSLNLATWQVVSVGAPFCTYGE